LRPAITVVPEDQGRAIPMFAEETEYWYVRDEGVVSGPFSLAELRARRDRGDLTWSQEVSQDGDVWVSASTLGAGSGGGPTRNSAKKGRGPAAYALASLVGAAFLGLGWIIWEGSGPDPGTEGPGQEVVVTTTKKDQETDPTPGPDSPVSLAITTAHSEKQLSSAVGFVVCGCVFESSDGMKTELPFVTGTCFAVSDKGYLLTNRHVVEFVTKYRDSELRKAAETKEGLVIEPRIWVFFLKKPERKLVKRLATIVFQTNHDDDVDLAVLKLESDTERLPHYFRLASRGSGDDLKATAVYSLGFPAAARIPISEERKSLDDVKRGTRIEDLFRESDFDYSEEHGIVNVIRRENGKSGTPIDWIFHGAKISKGNSGGPLITEDGTVVGINTLVQRIEEGAVTNYVALGINPVIEVLSKHVPQVAQAMTERVVDPRKGRSEGPAKD
jgi:hypothetical protein